MPQLDLTTFHSQIFWLVIIFTVFYYILSTKYLPVIGRILKFRRALSKKQNHLLKLHQREILRSSSSDFQSRQLKVLKKLTLNKSTENVLSKIDITPSFDPSILIDHKILYIVLRDHAQSFFSLKSK